MKRTKEPQKFPNRLPDIIMNNTGTNFTLVPNEVIRNPEISWKAKGLLTLLLSNKDNDWYSYKETIKKFGSEGDMAVDSGLKELEKNGYLIRLKYRDNSLNSKRIRGSIWICTSHAYQFDWELINSRLKKYNLEPVPILNKENPEQENLNKENPEQENLSSRLPKMKVTPSEGNQGLIIPNYKNINHNNTNSSLEMGETIITPSLFDAFWELYPRKDSKGAAKTAWKKLCNKKAKDRPSWHKIETALAAQKKSERWQDKQFIPLPTTWLNQERWLDDLENMVSFDNNKQSKPKQAISSPQNKQYPT